jgi:hypothetical protein
MPRAKKVVIIGAKGYKMSAPNVRVDCFPWQQIAEIPNLRDYDTVVVDLLGIPDKKSRTKINWDNVTSILNPGTALQILQHRGEIIVVGDPRFSIPRIVGTDRKGNSTYRETPFLQWTGIAFDWDNAPGDTIYFNDDYEHRHFEEYIKNLDRWNYSLSRITIDQDAVSKVFNLEYLASENLSLDVHSDFFCQNRYRNGLAFILYLQILRESRSYSGMDKETFLRFGPLVFLPEIKLSEDETLMIVLGNVCGIETSLPEPEWLAQYQAPGQKAVDEQINKIRAEIEGTKQHLQDALNRRAQIRTCLKLLYERETGLQPAVRDVLRGLGAHVEDPKEPNKEDGWLTVSIGDQVHEGALEIKSTRADQFSEDGIRQLLDWIDRGIQLRQKKYKGIFIGNSCVDKPLSERPWPFSDNWTKSVELHGMCALTTQDLYIIHLLKSAGRLDLDTFWQDIFETKGIFDSKKYSGTSPAV